MQLTVEIGLESINKFPSQSFMFKHNLESEKILSIEYLKKAAKSINQESVEGIINSTFLTGNDAIALFDNLADSKSWIILRNLEQLPEYKTLMNNLIRLIVCNSFLEKYKIINPMCFAFISSPLTKVIPHIDPEHNYLFHICGTKEFYINDSSDTSVISELQLFEFYSYEFGYRLELPEHKLQNFQKVTLQKNTGIYVPVTAPHWVENLDSLCISFSVTFRTQESEENRVNILNKYNAQ